MMLFLLIGRDPIQDVPTLRSFLTTGDHWQSPAKCDPPPYENAGIYREQM
jgi:hypothetical protein